jgi:hypothetical protein
MVPALGASSAGRFPLAWALPSAADAQPVCLPRGEQVCLTVSAGPTLQAARAPVGSPWFLSHPVHACRGSAPRQPRSGLA